VAFYNQRHQGQKKNQENAEAKFKLDISSLSQSTSMKGTGYLEWDRWGRRVEETSRNEPTSGKGDKAAACSKYNQTWSPPTSEFEERI
jgi:hypothetical protein